MVNQATQEDQVHPDKDFRNEFDPYLLTDDQVFKGSLVAYTRNQKDRVSLAMPHNDQALWHLINLGVRDMPLTDKPWDASTRSMRFATSLADRLWVMLDREHARVRLLLTLLDGVNSNHLLERLLGRVSPRLGKGRSKRSDQCGCCVGERGPDLLRHRGVASRDQGRLEEISRSLGSGD